ncbi:MAG: hypothetical protein BWX86_02642 [Verrucomicrobia bacterium ADurb.Bin122]|nr:MAG: hypothetical protein BWX86_02642 [Verrucomicrobia bacterium ADurb.Bin122]
MKTDSSRFCLEVLVTLSRQYSKVWPSGTKYEASVAMPEYSLSMIVYAMPWRQFDLYWSRGLATGCQAADQKSPVALSRR